MTPAIMARFARMSKPDFSLMNDEGFTASRLRIEILSGLTVALANGVNLSDWSRTPLCWGL
jgi:SulP family sulfate permease